MADDLNVIDGPPPKAGTKPGFTEAFKTALVTDFDDPDKTPEIKPAAPKQPEKSEAAKPVIPSELIKKETPAEPAKSELDSIPEPTDEKAKSGFKTLREKAKAFETKANELEKKIVEFEAKGKDSEGLQAKLADLEKKNAEYLEIVTRSNVENHPDFQKQFVEGRQNLIKRAQTIIEESGGDKNSIATALNLRGKARVDALREAASELDGFQQGRLGKVIDELSDLDEQADTKIAESRKTWETMQASDKDKTAKQHQEFAHSVQTSFETTAKRLRGELEVLAHVEGNDAWNQQADNIVKEAQSFVETNKDLPTSMEVAIWGKAGPVYREAFLAERKQNEANEKRIAEMTAELKGIYNKTPNLNAGKTTGAVPAKKMGFLERFGHEMTATE